MNALRRHWPRIVITLLPVWLALAHAAGYWRLPLIERLDYYIYDARLRATMPRTLDPRIVIVDVDDASLQRFGQWPWSRDKLARLTTELTGRQKAAVLGFDVMFVEPDQSSGLTKLRDLARGALREASGFPAQVEQLAPSLDHDAAFARALSGQHAALGYYFTQTDAPRARGQLPAPSLPLAAFPEGHSGVARWNGFGASLPAFAQAVPRAGFTNFLPEASADGVLRAAPLLARYDGPLAAHGYYESFGLAIYRMASNLPDVAPVFAAGPDPARPLLESLVVHGATPVRLPVDQTASLLVPFRGPGGARGGSFRYVAAADVLDGKLDAGALAGRIVLVGTTAPGLQDLRATPADATFPGVEVHANVISGLLDGRLPVVPDYAVGYDILVVVAAGLLLAIGMSLLPASSAVLLGLATAAALAALNAWLFLQLQLVMPLAGQLIMVALAFAANMSWGYFVEARSRRDLAQLFGTYVPPELVDEMLASPQRYSMRAENRELTVMFCDMRGFTRLSEEMAPAELQAFLNDIFSRLTTIIRAHRGTVDKYIGDCVMAFWGAPVATPDHAALAVQAALEMAAAVREVNEVYRASGRPGISVGIGLNTGVMSVGDMGSAVRRSYTVVGDAVNLASRLEGLSGQFGVEILTSETTRAQSPDFLWQQIDRVRVKGKAQAVDVFAPWARLAEADDAQQAQVAHWSDMLAAYRAQDWAAGQKLLAPLLAKDAKKVLYQLYAQRLASMALQPKDPNWDGATRFDTK